MKQEYRVVWKWTGERKKSKRFVSLKRAEWLFGVLGPNPWLVSGEEPDALHCRFDGCWCNGRTKRECAEARPPLEFASIEYRFVGRWIEKKRPVFVKRRLRGKNVKEEN